MRRSDGVLRESIAATYEYRFDDDPIHKYRLTVCVVVSKIPGRPVFLLGDLSSRPPYSNHVDVHVYRYWPVEDYHEYLRGPRDRLIYPIGGWVRDRMKEAASAFANSMSI